MTDPLSYARKQFYNEVREYDEYKSKRQKPSLWARLKTSLTFPSFTMGGVTNKSIEEYLSQARDHYDLEQRERKIMNRQVGFA